MAMEAEPTSVSVTSRPSGCVFGIPRTPGEQRFKSPWCYPEVVGQRVGFWYQKKVGENGVWLARGEEYVNGDNEPQVAVVPPNKDFWSKFWPRIATSLPDAGAAATFVLHQLLHLVYWDAGQKRYAYLSIDPHDLRSPGGNLACNPLTGLLDRNGTDKETLDKPGFVTAIVEKDEKSDWVFLLSNDKNPGMPVRYYCCNTQTASGLGKARTLPGLTGPLTTAYRDAAGTIILSTESADYTCSVRGNGDSGYTLTPKRKAG